MRHGPALLALVFAAGSVAAAEPASHSALTMAVKASTRSSANIARDRYRHPVETLSFFGVRPTDTVVEIWPSGGWYTEILGPYLAARGTLYAAGPDEKGLAAVKVKQSASPAAYHSMRFATFPAGAGVTPVPAGSADVVLTFRNVHNWRFGATDQTQAAFNQMFAMLKPGGTLGVVEHHLPEASRTIEEARSGYMKRSSVLTYATKAGFRLVDESPINANPNDTHDYPKGVWTLPPGFADGDHDRARYAAIGESDRMTLKFIKPT